MHINHKSKSRIEKAYINSINNIRLLVNHNYYINSKCLPNDIDKNFIKEFFTTDELSTLKNNHEDIPLSTISLLLCFKYFYLDNEVDRKKFIIDIYSQIEHIDTTEKEYILLALFINAQIIHKKKLPDYIKPCNQNLFTRWLSFETVYYDNFLPSIIKNDLICEKLINIKFPSSSQPIFGYQHKIFLCEAQLSNKINKENNNDLIEDIFLVKNTTNKPEKLIYDVNIKEYILLKYFSIYNGKPGISYKKLSEYDNIFNSYKKLPINTDYIVKTVINRLVPSSIRGLIRIKDTYNIKNHILDMNFVQKSLKFKYIKPEALSTFLINSNIYSFKELMRSLSVIKFLLALPLASKKEYTTFDCDGNYFPSTILASDIINYFEKEIPASKIFIENYIKEKAHKSKNKNSKIYFTELFISLSLEQEKLNLTKHKNIKL